MPGNRRHAALRPSLAGPIHELRVVPARALAAVAPEELPQRAEALVERRREDRRAVGHAVEREDAEVHEEAHGAPVEARREISLLKLDVRALVVRVAVRGERPVGAAAARLDQRIEL